MADAPRLGPRFVGYQQGQRWLWAGCFDQLSADLRAVLRLASGRTREQIAAALDDRSLCSARKSGKRAGYECANRMKGVGLYVRDSGVARPSLRLRGLLG